jgi:hypothetical protein
VQIDLLVLDGSPEAFDEDVVAPRALPSMLISMPLLISRLVNSALVNWLL